MKFHIWLKWDNNIRHLMWRPRCIYIVDSSTKYLVAHQECKANPLLCSFRSTNDFILLTAKCRSTAIQSGNNVACLWQWVCNCTTVLYYMHIAYCISLKIHFSWILLTHLCPGLSSSEGVSFLQVSQAKLCLHFSSTCATQLILPDLIHMSSIYWEVQIIKLVIMQFSPVSYYFLPFRSKYCNGRVLGAK